MTPAIPPEFWNRVNKTATCWLWTGGLNSSGYGRFTLNGVRWRVHRLVHVALVGPISDGLDIDHKCRVRSCVNPAHLQAVTRQANLENSGPHRDSRFGIRGISWHKRDRLYVAEVYVAGKRYRSTHKHLADAERAVIARRNLLMSNNLADREAS